MKIEEGFYWCETPETDAIFIDKSEMVNKLKEWIDEETDMDEVDIWHLHKISSENFHWEEVEWEDLMEEVLKSE